MHTGDWHLGKKLYSFNRHEEHKFFLKWLTDYITENKIDYLLVSGDIFDSPTPPHEAQALFFDFLANLNLTNIKKAFFISGNHDSVAYLKIPAPLINKDKIVISSGLESDLRKHIFRENSFNLVTLPFFKDSDLEKITDNFHDNVIDQINYFFEQTTVKDLPNILLAHHNFGKYSSSGTEHFVSLSGIETIPLNLVTKYFKYTALGHIHKKQQLCENPLVIYPGSPLPLRHSESNKKYISQFELSNGDIKQKFVEIPLLYQLKRIHIDFENLKTCIEQIMQPSLLEIHVDINENTHTLIDEIYKQFEKSEHKILSVKTHLNETDDSIEHYSIRDKNIDELFIDFYKEQTGKNLESNSLLLKEFRKLMAKTEINENQES